MCGSDVRGLSSARSVLGRGGADELSTVALLKDMYKFLDVQVSINKTTTHMDKRPEGGSRGRRSSSAAARAGHAVVAPVGHAAAW